MGADGRLSVDGFVKAMRHRLRGGHVTIGKVARWLYADCVILQHQLVATGKLPDNTFRFRREGDRLRFYNLSNSLTFMNSRFEALSTTVHELGLCGDFRQPDHPLTPDGKRLLAEGHKVRAIQLVRTVVGVGLREAKEYVDSLEARGDLEDEEPIDEQEEHARLVKEARFLLSEQARLERERDRLLAVQGRLRTRAPRASKRGKIRRNAPCPCGSGKK